MGDKSYSCLNLALAMISTIPLPIHPRDTARDTNVKTLAPEVAGAPKDTANAKMPMINRAIGRMFFISF
jgi:hypothetical protein